MVLVTCCDLTGVECAREESGLSAHPSTANHSLLPHCLALLLSYPTSKTTCLSPCYFSSLSPRLISPTLPLTHRPSLPLASTRHDAHARPHAQLTAPSTYANAYRYTLSPTTAPLYHILRLDSLSPILITLTHNTRNTTTIFLCAATRRKVRARALTLVSYTCEDMQ